MTQKFTGQADLDHGDDCVETCGDVIVSVAKTVYVILSLDLRSYTPTTREFGRSIASLLLIFFSPMVNGIYLLKVFKDGFFFS